MRTIIAGTRTISEMGFIEEAVAHCGWEITEVVCGTARGVDTLGKVWATGRNIPVVEFFPDWSGLGKRAGFVRNAQMADYADALILIWDGKSRGSAHMLLEAQRRNMKIVLHIIKPES